MNKKFDSAFWVCTFMIVAGAAFRVITNQFNNQLGMWNFSPIGAMALFAGVRFSDKKYAFIIPITAMLLSDLVIGFHEYMFPVYFSFALITCVGILISKRENVLTILFGSVSSSVIFFLVTNLVIWYGTSLYPHSLQGQVQSYTAALPFFRHTLLGDIFFNTVFFGSWYLIKRGYPSIAAVKA